MTRPPRLRLLALTGFACALLWPAPAALGQAGVSREDKIKAVLVFKLAKFVDWPAAALPDGAPIEICALGDSQVGSALAATEGQAIGGRPVHFRKVAGVSASELNPCHVLYVPAAQEPGNGLSAAVRARPLLTVGDAAEFVRRGGLIGLFRNDNKLSFEINLRGAREAGLKIGAPLLDLASVVD